MIDDPKWTQVPYRFRKDDGADAPDLLMGLLFLLYELERSHRG